MLDLIYKEIQRAQRRYWWNISNLFSPQDLFEKTRKHKIFVCRLKLGHTSINLYTLFYINFKILSLACNLIMDNFFNML